MKKILLSIIILLCFCVLSVGSITLANVIKIDEHASCSLLYSGEVDERMPSVDLGFGKQVFVDYHYIDLIDEEITSRSIELSFSEENLLKIKQYFEPIIVKKQYIEDYEIIYCNSKKLQKSINDFNLMIAFNKDKIVLGAPIIFGEF